MHRSTGLSTGIGLGVLASLLLGVGFAAPAQAVERQGDVYAALPAQVHINGTAVKVQVGGDLTAQDEVTVVLTSATGAYLDTEVGTYRGVSPLVIKTDLTRAGSWRADVYKVTQPCTYTGADVLRNCEQDYSYGPWYETVTGLTTHPSQTVAAKYDARTTLVKHVTRHAGKKVVTWVAHVTHYTRDGRWVAYKHIPVRINGKHAVTNGQGNVVLSGKGSHSPRYTVKTATTKTIWGSSTKLLIP